MRLFCVYNLLQLRLTLIFPGQVGPQSVSPGQGPLPGAFCSLPSHCVSPSFLCGQTPPSACGSPGWTLPASQGRVWHGATFAHSPAPHAALGASAHEGLTPAGLGNCVGSTPQSSAAHSSALGLLPRGCSLPLLGQDPAKAGQWVPGNCECCIFKSACVIRPFQGTR